MLLKRADKEYQQELHTWVAKNALRMPMGSVFLDSLNKTIAPGGATSLLDRLDGEIKALPSPATRAQMERSLGAIL
eukprot:4074838-Prymnesium_polylepis.1